MTTHTTASLAESLNRLPYGDTVRPYQERYSSSAAYEAEQHLQGRSHYYDEGTRRYFGCRVNSCWLMHDGLSLITLESVHGDMHGKTRVHRGVVFDVYGQCVYHPALEQAHKTANAARKALDAWLQTYAAAQHTVQAIREHTARQAIASQALAAVVAYN